MPTLLVSGGATVGAQIVSATDGAITIQSGPDGSKVNALAIDASGNTTAVAVNGTTMQQGGVAMPRMVLSTAQNTTSGTSIDFTGIPSWVKRITLSLSGVSTTGTSLLRFQLGSGSVETSGYVGVCNQLGGAAAAAASTAGFDSYADGGASNARHGQLVFTLIGSNTWTVSGCYNIVSAFQYVFSGSKALSGTLDRIRMTTVGGTDTFDAGTANILYEG